jgi:dTDP-4-amino-4,6-dideoxygalactose transaminase
VHSPIGLAALLAGAGGLLAGGTARDRVERLLRESYLPSGLLLTDSGTTALHLALRLAVAERPGPVALPAYCCYDIATATRPV